MTLTFSLAWGLQPILFAMVEDKEFLLAEERNLPAPFSEEFFEDSGLYNALAEAKTKLSDSERAQVEEWTEGWSKRGLPMKGWQGPEQLLQSLIEAEKNNCLHVWPAGQDRDTTHAQPLDIEDMCPFW